MIATGVLNLAGSLISIFGKRTEAQAQAVKEFANNMKRTWVDEILVVYWFLPTVLHIMFNYSGPFQRQMEMIGEGSFLFQAQVGISAAAFGLNKLVGKK